MTASNFNYFDTGKGIIKAWTKGVDVDEVTMKQVFNLASMPFIHKHVALMPDAHLGKGATIGSVIATKGAIIPAAVGVDIGCGMMAYQLSLKGSQLPDNLAPIRAAIEAAVPHGRTNNGSVGDRGAWGNITDDNVRRWNALSDRYDDIIEKHPKARAKNGANHLGTLGTGNHFIEVCLDEDDNVWVMLHSGSRGIGNKIGEYFISKAKEEMERYHIIDYLPDKDLSYLVEHTVLFDDYLEAVQWAQDFAAENRRSMMEATLGALAEHLPPFHVTEHAINCHHNYVAREKHFGVNNVLVTRKGAVRAREGDLGIIPGSMGTGSFIVRGKGNHESFCSCSHGAGRRMSRTQAHKEITLDMHAAATAGIECRKDSAVLDESPAAYKDIGAVIAAQSDLVEVVFRLKQIINVKG
jgi:tRNA-splicing ligase RtcB